ncbi:MAG TPA: winged helix-turn-helix domain-containing protein [Streptosporangiaceae bacterium]
MRAEAPALPPILRAQHRAELLTALLLHPDSEHTITELRLGVPLTTAQREVNRLSEAGLITERRAGRTGSSAPSPPAGTRPLTDLLALAFGPHLMISQEFADLQAMGERPTTRQSRQSSARARS